MSSTADNHIPHVLCPSCGSNVSNKALPAYLEMMEKMQHRGAGPLPIARARREFFHYNKVENLCCRARLIGHVSAPMVLEE
jgi:DNA-directed RNA polymerase subunit N (RpoN/RPB10)